MLPRHLNNVPEDRKAHAPYNFVELPNKIIEVKPEFLPQNNCYLPQPENRYTGRIKCKLTAKSPLYTRCGLSPNDFATFIDKDDEKLTSEERIEKRKILSDFFRNPVNLRPTISGSSLRGMLRVLIEIISFSKIEYVSDQQCFFFRAVAAKNDDPLGQVYKSLLKNVKAGYLVSKEGHWYIQPAKSINDSPFIWVKEQDLSKIHTLTRMDKPGYCPQYINVTFGDTCLKSPRRFTKQVSVNKNFYQNRGVIVTSGNMLESSQKPENLRRRNHCIVLEVDSNAKPLKISDTAILDYRSALTDFQKKEPFDKKMGVLHEGCPIFYCEPQNGQTEVTLFGHCSNFRIPYFPHRDGKAASAVKFIPKNIGKSEKIDLVNAIFGFVRERDKKISKRSDITALEALASRVFIEDAICEKNTSDDIWLTGNVNKIVTPKILSTPKPTTFQHYLIQKSSEKSQLKHYASKPPTDNESGETVIRGHKLYWHKPDVKCEDIQETDRENLERSRSQYTDIKPIKAGVSFNFNIHFENLNDIELGALLWVLNKAQDEQYCLSLGMGKPLGMGAVKIIHELHLSHRSSRYSKLFNENQWFTGEEEQSDTASKHTDCVNAFENYVINNIDDNDHPEGCTAKKLEEIPRIQMLLAMLRCDNPPDAKETEYMTIEPNEYKDRPVLPTPLQIMNISDKRRGRFLHSTPSLSTQAHKVIEKPKTKPKQQEQNSRNDSHKSHLDEGNSGNFATARPPKPKR